MGSQCKILPFLLLIFNTCHLQPIKINKDISGTEGLKINYLNMNKTRQLPQIYLNGSNIWIEHKLNATEFNSKFEEEPKSSEEMMIFKSISNHEAIEIDQDNTDKVNDGRKISQGKIEDRIDKIVIDEKKDSSEKPVGDDRTQDDETYVSHEDKIDRVFKQDYASLVKEFVRSTVLEELNKDYFKNNQEASNLFGVSKREIIKSLLDKHGPNIELGSPEYDHHQSEIPERSAKPRFRNVHTGLYGGVQMFSRGKDYASGLYKMKTTDVIYDPNPKDDDRSYESQSNRNKPSNDYYKSIGGNPPSVHEISSTEELETPLEDSRKFKSIIDSLDNYPSINYPKTSKHIYVHVPPPESSEEDIPKNIEPPSPEKHYKIIFIKTPQQKTKQPMIPPPPQKEEKTLIYVLIKKHEDVTVKIPTPASTLPSKPEVYYISYKQNKEDDLEYGAADKKEVTVPSEGDEVTTITANTTTVEEKQGI